MESNFEFLTKDQDTQLLYDTAKDAEELYTLGKFSNEFESIRKVVENMVRMILDFEYIEISEYSTLNDCLKEIRQKRLVNNDILDVFIPIKKYW
ncbi:hypothetical protein [Bombilactobacillus bombi]|uniref:hypothetical protein n=1 Tax=Bombilactobacillus bombi TaxID=1303590 RepID=UPI0026D0225F